jgi:hypothetical protein
MDEIRAEIDRILGEISGQSMIGCDTVANYLLDLRLLVTTPVVTIPEAPEPELVSP